VTLKSSSPPPPGDFSDFAFQRRLANCSVLTFSVLHPEGFKRFLVISKWTEPCATHPVPSSLVFMRWMTSENNLVSFLCCLFRSSHHLYSLRPWSPLSVPPEVWSTVCKILPSPQSPLVHFFPLFFSKQLLPPRDHSRDVQSFFSRQHPSAPSYTFFFTLPVERDLGTERIPPLTTGGSFLISHIRARP